MAGGPTTTAATKAKGFGPLDAVGLDEAVRWLTLWLEPRAQLLFG